VVPEHDAAAHCVVAGQTAQPMPLLLHAPVLPQVVMACIAQEAAEAVQQMPITQLPEAHTPSSLHALPGVLPTQTLLVQVPERQSALAAHFLPFLHVRGLVPVAQLPPQSTSVSSASWMPSMQCAAVHAPRPSQTLPVPSHAMPLGAPVDPHWWVVVSHLGVAHTVIEGGQSMS
jgi:hypothetical protein